MSFKLERNSSYYNKINFTIYNFDKTFDQFIKDTKDLIIEIHVKTSSSGYMFINIQLFHLQFMLVLAKLGIPFSMEDESWEYGVGYHWYDIFRLNRFDSPTKLHIIR